MLEPHGSIAIELQRASSACETSDGCDAGNSNDWNMMLHDKGYFAQELLDLQLKSASMG